MSLHPSRVTATVDYLTLTSIPSRGIKRRETKKLIALADDLISYEKGRGNDSRSWVMGNFRGYSTGAIQAGADSEGVLVRVSSHLAATYWRDLIKFATNISRLDLAVTVTLDDKVANLVRKHRAQVMRWRKTHMPQLQVGVIDRGNRGSTLALGSRQSDVYLRCYDKHRESHGDYPPGTWRYEVEYKRALAMHTAMEVANCSSESLTVGREVHRRFVARGCRPEYAPGVVDAISMRRVGNPDDDRRLRWLETGVRGTVEHLIARGRTQEVIAALGLLDLIHSEGK